MIVVHEWRGPNDYVRTRAKQLADMGYVAIAIDMYGNGKVATHPDDAKKFMMETIGNMDEAVKRFDAAKTLLASDPRVDGSKLASIGYCFGGAVSLHMARIGTDLDAIASFHGNLATQKPMPRGVFGGKILVAKAPAESVVPKEQLDAFKKAMDDAGATVRCRVSRGSARLHEPPRRPEGREVQAGRSSTTRRRRGVVAEADRPAPANLEVTRFAAAIEARAPAARASLFIDYLVAQPNRIKHRLGGRDFFDGACPLCRREVGLLQRMDRKQRGVLHRYRAASFALALWA